MSQLNAQLEQLYKQCPLYQELFAEQLALALCPERYAAALCGRRAGKTTACAIILFQELLRYPRSKAIFLALTEASVRDIFLPVVHDIIDKYKIKAVVQHNTIKFQNGSVLSLFGANHINKIESFRGQKLRMCILDEAGSFSEKILRYLIDDIVSLTLADLQGRLIMIGTPSASCSGFFHDVTSGQEGEWGVLKWTGFNNPYMQRQLELEADKFCKRKHCDRNHPTFRREFMGEWVRDQESLLIRDFSAEQLPEEYNEKTWETVLGVDFGFNDATAFSIIGWRRHDPTAYILESREITKASVSTIGKILQQLKDKYHPKVIVGDPAGASKIIMEEYSTKWGIHMESAQKTDKAHYIEIFSDALVNREIILNDQNTRGLQGQMRTVVWNEERTRELEGMECDQLDAALYCFRASLHYRERILGKEVVKTDTEKAIEQAKVQFKAAQEQFWSDKQDSVFDIPDTNWYR